VKSARKHRFGSGGKRSPKRRNLSGDQEQKKASGGVPGTKGKREKKKFREPQKNQEPEKSRKESVPWVFFSAEKNQLTRKKTRLKLGKRRGVQAPGREESPLETFKGWAQTDSSKKGCADPSVLLKNSV